MTRLATAARVLIGLPAVALFTAGYAVWLAVGCAASELHWRRNGSA